ncbi:Zn-ribbon domain-containing OB-fold protein [Actinomadura madurae]|uniref:Zn-ribbon domain-containing OB-fold protein n=1 Tax=Actinomadura madurae TaxID=1993 RepID=UPI002025E537|nr:Zn-ribbon domain-containing OB-fold protein [Actinomadura madurae]MCP9948307.1 Zn-ribbon domain-containing OB-fold protein [Actinomadura madurae]MCP9965081.1 Zn-ribbon domain-containing OB-fold protein [Actinomadura madurae]MCP9977572.1 Zn-ribbon domain-containing OB-fold protein [Actinomadura madurae]MCQ0010930.1 Zn-ribbon domain-containing OB-fold protein [Actinomadura madurae]MCQ0013758.1 Zn-ribbon domain-containing OB-fold protein [Actinomadura madurae]
MSAPVTSAALPADKVNITTDGYTEPFWQAAKEDRLVAPKCGECGHFRLPPTPFCPQCQSREVEWTELSGVAEVFSFSVLHGFPGIPDITMIAAVLDLPDAPGARLVSNIVGADPGKVAIGDRVEVFFSPISDGWKIPLFRPLG